MFMSPVLCPLSWWDWAPNKTKTSMKSYEDMKLSKMRLLFFCHQLPTPTADTQNTEKLWQISLWLLITVAHMLCIMGALLAKLGHVGFSRLHLAMKQRMETLTAESSGRQHHGGNPTMNWSAHKCNTFLHYGERSHWRDTSLSLLFCLRGQLKCL